MKERGQRREEVEKEKRIKGKDINFRKIRFLPFN